MELTVEKKVYGVVMTSSPSFDAERHEGEQDRVRARRDADGVLHAAVARDCRFELLDLLPENELLRRENLVDRRPGSHP